MDDVEFFDKMYTAGLRAGLFKNRSPDTQNLQVVDFLAVPGPIDIHLTYDQKIKGEYGKVKNLHLTVRYRGMFNSEVTVINQLHAGRYKRDKKDPALLFYLRRVRDKNGCDSVIHHAGDQIKNTRVNVLGYIERINYLIREEKGFMD